MNTHSTAAARKHSLSHGFSTAQYGPGKRVMALVRCGRVGYGRACPLSCSVADQNADSSTTKLAWDTSSTLVTASWLLCDLQGLLYPQLFALIVQCPGLMPSCDLLVSVYCCSAWVDREVLPTATGLFMTSCLKL